MMMFLDILLWAKIFKVSLLGKVVEQRDLQKSDVWKFYKLQKLHFDVSTKKCFLDFQVCPSA